MYNYYMYMYNVRTCIYMYVMCYITCQQVSKQMMEVFMNAEEVMCRFIQNVTEKVLLVCLQQCTTLYTCIIIIKIMCVCNPSTPPTLQEHVNKELKGKPTEAYLQRLYQLHLRSVVSPPHLHYFVSPSPQSNVAEGCTDSIGYED